MRLFVDLNKKNETYLNSQEVAQKWPATVGHCLQEVGVLRYVNYLVFINTKCIPSLKFSLYRNVRFHQATKYFTDISI